MVDSSKDEQGYLADILFYILRARKHTQGIDFNREQFYASPLHQDAVIRCIEIIGEAFSRIAPDTRKYLPQISWNKMIGMRNRLIHDYSDFDLDIVWVVVLEKLPPLIEVLEPLLPPENTPAQ